MTKRKEGKEREKVNKEDNIFIIEADWEIENRDIGSGKCTLVKGGAKE